MKPRNTRTFDTFPCQKHKQVYFSQVYFIFQNIIEKKIKLYYK